MGVPIKHAARVRIPPSPRKCSKDSPGANSAVEARQPEKLEVTGSNPVSPTDLWLASERKRNVFFLSEALA